MTDPQPDDNAPARWQDVMVLLRVFLRDDVADADAPEHAEREIRDLVYQDDETMIVALAPAGAVGSGDDDTATATSLSEAEQARRAGFARGYTDGYLAARS